MNHPMYNSSGYVGDVIIEGHGDDAEITGFVPASIGSRISQWLHDIGIDHEWQQDEQDSNSLNVALPGMLGSVQILVEPVACTTVVEELDPNDNTTIHYDGWNVYLQTYAWERGNLIETGCKPLCQRCYPSMMMATVGYELHRMDIQHRILAHICEEWDAEAIRPPAV